MQTDPLSGFVMVVEEQMMKTLRKDENTTNEWKSNNLVQLKERLSSWQQKHLKNLINLKLKNGMSLIKQNLLEQKNKS